MNVGRCVAAMKWERAYTAGLDKAVDVQELCNGGSLRSALRRGILSPGSMQPRWPSVLRILCGIAAGMDHMHTLRVYHGALAPSNILFKVRAACDGDCDGDCDAHFVYVAPENIWRKSDVLQPATARFPLLLVAGSFWSHRGCC